jgi:hypothetical protein
MFTQRLSLYQELEKLRESKILVYVTGDRSGLNTQIHPEVLDYLTDHLDKITGRKKIPKISLFLYTSGGLTIAAWSIVNLLRQFCKEYEVIIPAKAHSAGTIIVLGANKILMTKQATLSPIDPSYNGPLNPSVNGLTGNITVPVSVEAINGFFDLIRNDIKIKNKKELAQIVIELSEKIHPLVLGETYRARNQIKRLAEKLLLNQINNKKYRKKIIDFLTADSGSHDYTINRQEAKEYLGLPVETPSEAQYDIIKKIFDDIKFELEMNIPFNPNSLFGPSIGQISYSFRQALIESIDYKSHVFVKEGIMTKTISNNQFGIAQEIINDQPVFLGWKYER